ncbi:hypothetical protein [Mesorhizobium sp. B2-9-1]|uniref:hypothetical protein n=1 Tax=Mesorhizobium sp. B2-9-1 TaxID=2589898 RepID=UPI0015E33388|nr:hypothetical protein [Mesorhizobium sp. B2-9-1]
MLRLQGFLRRSGLPHLALDSETDACAKTLIERFHVNPHHLPIVLCHATQHPIIEGYDPPEGWGWCFVDEVFIDLGEDTTPQNGPIPKFV